MQFTHTENASADIQFLSVVPAGDAECAETMDIGQAAPRLRDVQAISDKSGTTFQNSFAEICDASTRFHALILPIYCQYHRQDPTMLASMQMLLVSRIEKKRRRKKMEEYKKRKQKRGGKGENRKKS